MRHAIIVHTYDGQKAKVIIPESVIESLYLILHYEISGDEIYTFIQDDGDLFTVDAMSVVEGALLRTVGCGPENLTVIFPEDMQWEVIHEA